MRKQLFKEEPQQRALPLDDDSSSLKCEDEYMMPEEYGDAIAYLRGVRAESNKLPHHVKSSALTR